MISVTPNCCAQLDPYFVPAKLWNRQYQKYANTTPGARSVSFAMDRPDGTCWVYDTVLMPQSRASDVDTFFYCERIVKFLLWAWGGHRIRISNAPEIVAKLQQTYAINGDRKFDFEFLGEPCYDAPLTIENADRNELNPVPPKSLAGVGSLNGNRIGIDLGGSDRKCAAMIDGKVVFSEEVKWSPYFESDPSYHRQGIQDSLERAARHLPHVDAIGGSSAGIHINSKPRVGSLFRGVSQVDFKRHIQPIYEEIQKDWGGVPFEVVNDGDVTAMAGAMAMNENAVLGVAMGTSQAVGYLDPDGYVTGWLNELAFAPVDYQQHAAVDEWSGDKGCGVQYFSQQAVDRLIPKAGLDIDETLALPEKLEAVQAKMREGNAQAAAIYNTIGTYFGYSIAHYADFYDFKNLLVLGRVSSGEGGNIIMEEARRVLEIEFPALAESIQFQTPDEKTKRHGQAIAAASLPSIS